MRRSNFILLLILLVAIFLRFWNLSIIPPSLSHDEAAIGYNAWSILQTGKDEYGTTLPLLFRSFDDYKLPGYVYAVVISEKLFGLNEFAVRFPSAFLGTMTVVVLYFLMKEILNNKKTKFDPPTCGLNSKPSFASTYAKTTEDKKASKGQSNIQKSKYFKNSDLGHLNLIRNWKFEIGNLNPIKSDLKLEIPLLAAGMLAISPWHVNFSRAAFESNGSVFFIVLTLLFLFKSLRKPQFLIYAAISSVFAIYFYYTARIILPIFVVVFILIYKNKVVRYKRVLIISLFVGFILMLPLIPQMFSSGLSRVNQVSIFEEKTLTNPYSEAVVRNNNSVFAKTLYNRRMAYMQQFSDNYLKNFAPDYYFTNGTGPMGLLHLWEIPFFFYGIYQIAKLKEKWKWIFLVWFFSVPLVGGFTIGQPNALRTLANAPIAAIFSAFGLYGFITLYKNNVYKKLSVCFIGIAILFFFVRFLILYFDYNPRFVAVHWGDGHKQMVEYVKENAVKYDKIFITGDYWRPYIYMLFYMNYPPSKYQIEGSRYQIKNINFGQADWDRGNGISLAKTDLSLLVDKKTLFILSSKDFFIQKNLIETEKRPYIMKIIEDINGAYADDVFYAVVMQ